MSSSPNTSFTKITSNNSNNNSNSNSKSNPKDISLRNAIRNANITHTTLDSYNKRLKEENDELRNIINNLKQHHYDLEQQNNDLNNDLNNANNKINILINNNNELNDKYQDLLIEYEAAEVLLKESAETMKLMKGKLDLEKQIRLEQTQKATSLELRLVELTKKAEESYSDSYKRFIEDYNNSKKPTTAAATTTNDAAASLPPAHKAIEQLLHMEEITYQRKLKLRDSMKQAVNQLCDRLVELEHVSAQVDPMLANDQEEPLSPVSSPLKDGMFGSPSFRYPISDLQLTESIYENENHNNSHSNHIEESMMTVESDI